jgi:hypothetical protein
VAITLVGTPQVGSAIDNNNVTLTFDVTPQQDDVVLVFGGPAIIANSAIDTTGYTALTSDGLNSQSRAWYKVMGTTPDTDVVGNGGSTVDNRDGVAYLSYVLRGVSTAITDAAPIRQRSSGTSSIPDPLSITTVTNGAWVFALYSETANVGPSTSGLLPSGYIGEVVAVVTSDNFDIGIVGGYKEVVTAGPEDPGALTSTTWTAAQWCTNTIAIRPAAASTGAVIRPTPTFLLLGVGSV